MFADAVTAEAGTGGSRDVINASNVDVVTTGLADTDYTQRSGDIAEQTVIEKVGTTKLNRIVTTGLQLYEEVATLTSIEVVECNYVMSACDGHETIALDCTVVAGG